MSKSTDKEETIRIRRGQEFRIILESNPTSGFRWLPIFDESIINLISHNFLPSHTMGIGQSGEDVFVFRAVSSGSYIVKMLYKREWEKRYISKKLFAINVK